MLRTHTCGQLREKDTKATVTLCGWVHRRRDHGGLIFVDLRDRYGYTQIVFDPKNKALFSVAEHMRSEWVIQVTGTVTRRLKGAARADNPTGAMEVHVSDMVILNEAKTPPFEIDQDKDVSEELRLEYRYLDLRRERMRRNMVMRHRIVQSIRKFFYDRDFIEVETPILIKGTPEGAREYLVPSRLYHGEFYVLPQSPQQLKQLTMIAGLDRYMQIAHCFRDEDQRGDRQPEFTQVDVEMSFVTPEDVMQLTEESLIALTKEIRPDIKILKTPFPRLTYGDAMNRYGSDKPDLRFDLAFTDVSDLCKGAGFGIFAKAVALGGVVKCLRVPDGAKCTRKEIDELTETAKMHGAKGLAWIKVGMNGCEGMPVDTLGKDRTAKIVERAKTKVGDILFFAADTFATACTSLGAVRTELGKRLHLIDPTVFAYCWVTDFPMFERDTETGGVAAVHHPFTRPMDEDRELLNVDPIATRAMAYDIVLNGSEIGGGSIRIHETTLQSRVFEILKISPSEAERRFGHLLRAFQYGAPPHGGIAWGVDRIVMLFCNEPNIREVIAFPKDQKAKDVMLGAPSAMPEEQIAELGMKIVEEEK